MLERTLVNPVKDFWTGVVQFALDEQPVYSEYRNRPNDFAQEVLGVQWTQKVQEIAAALLVYPKVVVPAGHSVGKTHGVAGIALWWLSTRKTKIVTTAPVWRQVKDLLWRELRNQHANALKNLPGAPLTTEWNISVDWFATGISTNVSTRFQGYHAEELLVILDEACGVEKFIWAAIEDGLAVSAENRILAIGNPTDPTGRFAQVCRSSEWKKYPLSCLDHPNIVQGKTLIRGAVSTRWVEERIKRWCIPYDDLGEQEAVADVFTYKGQQYIPNDMFRIRVLGQFPVEGGAQVFPLSYIWKAFNRDPVEPKGNIHMGVDVARFGDDNSVLSVGASNGVVLKMDVWQGARTTESAGRVKWWASTFGRVENIAVDEIGVGGGVVDELAESNYPVMGINVAAKPYDTESYVNLRDELTFALADEFRAGRIDLSRVIEYEEIITEELSSITFDYTRKGQRKVAPKAEVKEKIGRSPDFVDSLMLLFAYLGAHHISGVVPKPRSESWDTLL